MGRGGVLGVFGVALGTLSTLLTVGKHIKMVSCYLNYNYVTHCNYPAE